MKKWRGSLGAKFIAWVLITVNVLLFFASLAFVFVIRETKMYEYASRDAYREELYEKAANQYAVRALSNIHDWQENDFRDAPNFHYGIIKVDNIEHINLKFKGTYLENNFAGQIDDAEEQLYKFHYEINDSSWFTYTGTLFGDVGVHSLHEYVSNESISQVVYNMSDGIFYYETDEKLYPVRKIAFSCPDTECTKEYTVAYNFEAKKYEIEIQANDVEKEVDSVYEIDEHQISEIMQSTYMTFRDLENIGWTKQEWGELILDGKTYSCDENTIATINDEYLKSKEIVTENDYEVSADEGWCIKVTHHESAGESYWVIVQKPTDIATGLSSDLFVQANTLATYGYGLRYLIYVILLLVFAGGIGCFVFLLYAAGHRNGKDEIVTTIIDRMPFDVYAIFAFLTMLFVLYGMIEISNYDIDLPIIVAILFLLFVEGWILLFSFLTLAVRVKVGKWWRNTVCFWVLHKVYLFIRTVLSNIDVLWKAIIIIGALSVLEFLVVSWDGIGRITRLWALEKVILVPLILLALVQVQKLKAGAKRMAEGDLEHRIDTERMFGEFREHGQNLNSISEGMSRAVDERMKSERFKTELITNVSHDIKTPLTSIINYVDLLEKEEIHNKTIQDYLEVLNRQSARLKKLIEDLIEASKASTGNLAVHLEKLEADVFAVQIVGEFEDKLKENELTLVIDKPGEPIPIQADGRHFWRVIDNLMNNVCKYAQPGTRVYVNLERVKDEAVLTFRNTSKYALNISSEELMERFVRGDSSRNTEGSGLGLSIAKSLMELMGGSFELYVDGDLFKVVLRFPCVNEEKSEVE